MWKMAAPASNASFAEAAISSGVTGTGCCFGLVSTPLSAQVRIALSMSLPYFDAQAGGRLAMKACIPSAASSPRAASEKTRAA